MPGPIQRERALFEEALDLSSPEERTAFLERECAGDPLLRAQVEGLLEACREAEGFLAEGATHSSRPGEQEGIGPQQLESGRVIGRYRLLRPLGEGGFGVVYLAEQQEPVDRRVALKLLKLGMDTRHVLARFDLERQALAMMDHPGIARVFDAGSTENGRPFFVMELVDGVPVTRFCDDERLGIRERLELFARICDAVQHAHQKGIIHRDLKPTNVLAARRDGRVETKVIDFGIAKATHPEWEDATALTAAHQLLGTPAYMSPEQACIGARDIDTRSDVYSLGVLLYELLTGRTPFDGERLLRTGLESLRRVIREEEPLRPSVCVSQCEASEARAVESRRRVAPGKLSRLLRGDLDWIVMRALEKDRDRRYASAGELAADVARHLANQPVSAAAPSWGYRMSKFVHRHRTGLLTAGSSALLLLGGSGGVAYFGVWALRSDRALRGEAAVTQALNRFLTEDFLSQADPELQPERDLRLRTVLDRAAAQVGERFRDQPLVEAAIRATLGRAYENLGEFESAEVHLRRAYEIRFHELGEEHVDTLGAMSDLALVLSQRDEDEAALGLITRVHDAAKARFGEDHPFTVSALCRVAHTAFLMTNYPLAAEKAREAVEACSRVPETPVEDYSRAAHVHARTLGRQGNPEEGEVWLRKSVDRLRAELGPSHPQTLASMSRLGAFLYDHSSKREDAERIYLEALELSRRTLGESHLRSLILRGNLALLYRYRFEDRWGDALHHELKKLQFSAPRTGAGDLEGLGRLLREAPPGIPERAAELAPDAWRMRVVRPSAGWDGPGYAADAASGWLAASAVPASPHGEIWMRQEIVLGEADSEDWVVLVRSTGRCEVFLNGVAAGPVATSPGERLQATFFSNEARSNVRPGRNVLAIHGRDMPEGEFIDVSLVRIPPASTKSNSGPDTESGVTTP